MSEFVLVYGFLFFFTSLTKEVAEKADCAFFSFKTLKNQNI